MLHALIAVLALAVACSDPSTRAAPAVAVAAPANAGAAPGEMNLSGRVAEKIDASTYSYLRLVTPSGEVWAAVPKSTVEVGAQATIAGASWMENFTSTTLARTWPRIAFGTLAEEAPSAKEASPVPRAGHGSAGMFAQQAAQASPTQAPEVKDQALSRVATREGRTIAEIYAQKAALKDKSVSVRGKVVKAVDGVMGKTWLHLRDGTGTGPSADLAVTSDTSAKVGDVVVATGKVHLDRDLGSGYRYDILLEDSQLKKE